MSEEATCTELAELGSAYVDGALGHADRERLLAHLVHCESCRVEIEELRRIRRRLSETRPPAAAADHLSDKLISIAGEQTGADPRRLTPVVAARRRTRRRVAAAVAVLGLGVVAVGGIGYAASPPSVTAAVADPTDRAVAEFSSALGQVPLTTPASSALADVPELAGLTGPAPTPVRTDPASQLSAEAARAALEQTGRAAVDLSYRGTQTYAQLTADGLVSARLEVTSGAGQGVESVVSTVDGRTVGSSYLPASARTRLAESELLGLLNRNYRLLGWSGARAAGRPALVVEARTAATPVASVGAGEAGAAARWWIDESTGLLLWQETYDRTGRLLTATGFTALEIGGASFLIGHSASSERSTTASMTTSRASDLVRQGWSCADELAGLTLVRLRSDEAAHPGMLHMIYTDGLSMVSVLEERGRLAEPPPGSRWNAALGAYLDPGSPTTATWQSGDTVFTVVTNGSPDLLARTAERLPHEALPSRTTMERVRAGWARILGAS